MNSFSFFNGGKLFVNIKAARLAHFGEVTARDAYKPRPTRMRFSCVMLRSVTMRPRICMDAS